MQPLIRYNPSASLVKSILCYQKHSHKSNLLSSLLAKIATINYLFWTVVTSSDISKNVKINSGLQLPHPNGITIHGDVTIGAECMIMQQVTIGQLADGAVPTIGNGVYIGAGAKILGGVTIGDNSRVGANAVVLINVPAGKTAVGVPAIIKD